MHKMPDIRLSIITKGKEWQKMSLKDKWIY